MCVHWLLYAYTSKHFGSRSRKNSPSFSFAGGISEFSWNILASEDAGSESKVALLVAIDTPPTLRLITSFNGIVRRQEISYLQLFFLITYILIKLKLLTDWLRSIPEKVLRCEAFPAALASAHLVRVLVHKMTLQKLV